MSEVAQESVTRRFPTSALVNRMKTQSTTLLHSRYREPGRKAAHQLSRGRRLYSVCSPTLARGTRDATVQLHGAQSLSQPNRRKRWQLAQGAGAGSYPETEHRFRLSFHDSLHELASRARGGPEPMFFPCEIGLRVPAGGHPVTPTLYFRAPRLSSCELALTRRSVGASPRS